MIRQAQNSHCTVAEVIALHVQMTLVEIGVLGFEKPIKFFPNFANWDLLPDLLDTSPYELLEEVIIWKSYRSRSKYRYKT